MSRGIERGKKEFRYITETHEKGGRQNAGGQRQNARGHSRTMR